MGDAGLTGLLRAGGAAREGKENEDGCETRHNLLSALSHAGFNADKSLVMRKLKAFFLILAQPWPAQACEETTMNAIAGKMLLDRDTQAASLYRAQMAALETRCQKAEAEISSRAATAATAASCVALTEFSKLNEDLTKESSFCAQKSLEMESRWTELREKQAEPNQNFMVITNVGLKRDAELIKNCASQVSAFDKIAAKSRELVEAVRISEARSRDNKVKFTALAKQTDTFRARTAAAAKNCVGDEANTAVKTGPGIGSASAPARVPASKKNKTTGSSITGVDEAKKKEAGSQNAISR